MVQIELMTAIVPKPPARTIREYPRIVPGLARRSQALEPAAAAIGWFWQLYSPRQGHAESGPGSMLEECKPGVTVGPGYGPGRPWWSSSWVRVRLGGAMPTTDPTAAYEPAPTAAAGPAEVEVIASAAGPHFSEGHSSEAYVSGANSLDPQPSHAVGSELLVPTPLALPAAPDQGPESDLDAEGSAQRPRATRVSEGALLGGVCTGLARHLGWP